MWRNPAGVREEGSGLLVAPSSSDGRTHLRPGAQQLDRPTWDEWSRSRWVSPPSSVAGPLFGVLGTELAVCSGRPHPCPRTADLCTSLRCRCSPSAGCSARRWWRCCSSGVAISLAPSCDVGGGTDLAARAMADPPCSHRGSPPTQVASTGSSPISSPDASSPSSTVRSARYPGPNRPLRCSSPATVAAPTVYIHNASRTVTRWLGRRPFALGPPGHAARAHAEAPTGRTGSRRSRPRSVRRPASTVGEHPLQSVLAVPPDQGVPVEPGGCRTARPSPPAAPSGRECPGYDRAVLHAVTHRSLSRGTHRRRLERLQHHRDRPFAVGVDRQPEPRGRGAVDQVASAGGPW